MKEKKKEARDINGQRIYKSKNGWIVDAGTKPVDSRSYHGNTVDWERLSCFENGKYKNVEFFQPVIYDLDDPMPKYNPRWEVHKGSGKNKKLLRIDFPPSYQRYWGRQAERCINGYDVGGVHLTGYNYFFLNFWRISSKSTSSGFIVPRFIDVGKMFFDYIEQAQQQDKNVMFLKRRQIGFSEMCASLVGYNYTFFPASESLIIAGEGTYAVNTTEKTRLGLNELHRDASDSGDAFYKRRMIDTVEETKSGYLDNGIKKGFQSRFLSITTGGNVQRASGKKPSLVIMEESGRFQYLQTVYNMILPSIQEGGLQNGRIVVFIGTGGEMDKGVAEMQELFYDPEAFGLLDVPNQWDHGIESSSSSSSIFFPAWMYYVTDYDGNSYKELGEVMIAERREKLKNKPDSLHVEKTQMPLTPAEAFTASGLSPFNVIKLSEQKTKVLGNKWNRIAQYGRLDWVYDHNKVIIGVKWTGADDVSALDSEGDLKYPIMILEHPETPERSSGLGKGIDEGQVLISDPYYANLYCGGTDPYDKDKAEWSDSLGSCSIFKGIRDDNISNSIGMHFVARLTWRPIKAEKFYEMTARMHVYFHAQNLIEYSNIGIFNWHQKNGWESLLKERPLLASAVLKETKVENRYGIDPHTKSYWEDNYAAYIEDYVENMYDLEQLQRGIAYRRKLPNGKRYNCDITISSMLAYQHYLDNVQRRFKIVGIEKKKKGGKPLFGTFRDIGGHLHKVA